MITRPLDLASKLRPPPQNLEYVFLVNVGLIALFFSIWGSRFVLSPGLGMDFALPQAPAGAAAVGRPTHFITVGPRGQIYADTVRNLAQFGEWLEKERASAEALGEQHPVLLVRADMNVSSGTLLTIGKAALEAGFTVTFAGQQSATPPGGAPATTDGDETRQ